MIEVPEVVSNKARAVGAEHWLTELPELVAGLEADWAMTVGVPYKGATEAFVAPVTLADGTDAVLKLFVPRSRDVVVHEITALRLANGEGCVQLLRDDASRGALLLERLGPSLFDLARPIEERHEILCATAIRFWRPASGCGLPTGASKSAWLAEYIATMREATDRPCSERAIVDALACAQRRRLAHNDERAVLVHGDLHQWNALQSGSGFKLVDPDGLIAEAEYDLGIIMREDPIELREGDPRDRAHWLAARTGLDATAIWEWGVVERVSTGLLCAQVDLQPLGREMLATADHVAR
jgi:streptomycin 6-kinase